MHVGGTGRRRGCLSSQCQRSKSTTETASASLVTQFCVNFVWQPITLTLCAQDGRTESALSLSLSCHLKVGQHAAWMQLPTPTCQRASGRSRDSHRQLGQSFSFSLMAASLTHRRRGTAHSLPEPDQLCRPSPTPRMAALQSRICKRLHSELANSNRLGLHLGGQQILDSFVPRRCICCWQATGHWPTDQLRRVSRVLRSPSRPLQQGIPAPWDDSMLVGSRGFSTSSIPFPRCHDTDTAPPFGISEHPTRTNGLDFEYAHPR